MLSEDTINNLVQPLITRQENINVYILRKIADRINEIGHLLPSDIHKLERLLRSGNDVREINQYLAEQTDLQETEIKQLIKDIAKDSYLDAKPFYDYRHKSFIPFVKNVPLQRIVTAIAAATAEEYKNLSNSKAIGFLIRDLKHPNKLKFQSVKDTYSSVVDEAIQAVQSGTIDYNTAMRRTMKQLVDSGVRKMYWESGYSQRLDTAVRRNILDGVRAINQGVQDETGRQFGADGKEITVHENPAPDHEPIQGHQFTNAEYDKLQNDEPFQDVLGNKFTHIKRAIGTLNCRHFTYSIIIGQTQPNYTLEQLEQIKKRNSKGYTDKNGKHYTMYECTQKQRQLETLIRKNKDGQIAAKASGDMELAQAYQAKINKYTKQYKAFSKVCGLSPKMSKASVSGYKRMKLT